MKFDQHIKDSKKSLTKSIYKQMSILRNVKPHVSKTTLASIWNSLISSTILFGAPIWSQTSETNIAQVQRAQTKVARLVAGKNNWG